MDIAAFQGHVEVLRTMLDIEKHPVCLRFALQDGVSFGNAGNQVGSLDACLDSAYNGYQRGLVGILERTRTIPLFDRLYQVCKDHLTNGHRNPWEPELDKRQIQVEFLSGHFHRAALDGKLALMNHLVQLGSRRTHVDRVVDNKNGYRELVSRVAEKGYADVLTYLLENRAKIGSRSLEAACDHGNPDTVRILLEYGARDSWKPGNALLKAAERENETALRLLLETGTLIDKDQKQQVLNFAKEEGLSSMVKILEEYR